MSERKRPSLEAVVFDMDGLMFDTERLYFESEEELLGRRDRSFSVELAQRMMGLPAPRAMERASTDLPAPNGPLRKRNNGVRAAAPMARPQRIMSASLRIT